MREQLRREGGREHRERSAEGAGGAEHEDLGQAEVEPMVSRRNIRGHR